MDGGYNIINTNKRVQLEGKKIKKKIKLNLKNTDVDSKNLQRAIDRVLNGKGREEDNTIVLNNINAILEHTHKLQNTTTQAQNDMSTISKRLDELLASYDNLQKKCMDALQATFTSGIATAFMDPLTPKGDVSLFPGDRH